MVEYALVFNKHKRHLTLLPERPIFIYPSLAATIGLEEATMLSVLQEISAHAPGQARNGYTWFHVNEAQMNQVLPFWDVHDIQRVSTNLREKGLIFISSAPYTSGRQLRFALNQNSVALQPTAINTNAAPSGPSSPNLIAPHWQPDKETYERLAQHNIPSAFARQQIPEFVDYWRERKESKRAWGSVFMKHVLHKWHEFKANKQNRPQGTGMHKGWRPSADAIEVLTQHGGISLSFVEDAIPEFELYWREQGSVSDNWNRKFRDHVHRQWLKFKSALEHDTTPRRIDSNWTPSKDVYDVLALANIDLAFAKSLIPEFVIYWRDTNQVHSSWNTRFMQYVKKRWATRPQLNPQAAMAPQAKSTRDLTLHEQLTDRSWAE